MARLRIGAEAFPAAFMRLGNIRGCTIWLSAVVTLPDFSAGPRGLRCAELDGMLSRPPKDAEAQPARRRFAHPERPGLVEHPGIHRGEEGVAGDEVHLQRQYAEEEVAVSGTGHGENRFAKSGSGA